jgi:phytoene desaturase
MKVLIIGAGVGGMATACRLARLGCEVEIYEKKEKVGGRLSNFEKSNFRVDAGPTLLLMPWVLRRVFTDLGKKINDYLELTKLHPVYKIYFEDGMVISPYSEKQKMFDEISKFSKKDAEGYLRYLADYKKYYEIALKEFIEKNFNSPLDMLTPKGIISLISGGALRDLYSKTGDYFSDPRVRIVFSLQSVYIGAAPTKLPAVYGLIPYVEFTEGVWYPKGGLYSIAETLALLCKEFGVKIHTKKPVKKIIVENSVAKGLQLEDGKIVLADAIISNADLPYTYLHLLDEEDRLHMPDSKVKSLKTSCSAFMMYLGLKGKVDLAHHSFILPNDYLKTFEDIFERKVMPKKPGIYVANPCSHDKTLAPRDKSIIYVLVPVPNLLSGIDWKIEAPRLRKQIIQKLESIGVKDLEKRIVMEKIFTPLDWRDSFGLENGATFGLSPGLFQSAAFRPSNKDKKIKGLYFVGASTHPGSGIPIVLLSAELMEKRFKEDFGLKNKGDE